MFACAKEQLACTPVGNTDAGMLSCGLRSAGKGFAYRPQAISLTGSRASTASSSQISKRFVAHRGNLLGSYAGRAVHRNAAPVQLWNPEDRP